MLNLGNPFIIWLVACISIMTIVVSICTSTRSLARLHTLRISTSTSCFISVLSTYPTNLRTCWKCFLILIPVKHTRCWSLLWNPSNHWISIFIITLFRIRQVTLLISSVWETFSCIGTCISSFLTTVGWMTVLFHATNLSRVVRLIFILSLAVAFHFTDIHFKHVLQIVSFLWSWTSSSTSIFHFLVASPRWERWILFPLWTSLVIVIIIDAQLNLWMEVFVINLRKTWLKALSI